MSSDRKNRPIKKLRRFFFREYKTNKKIVIIDCNFFRALAAANNIFESTGGFYYDGHVDIEEGPDNEKEKGARYIPFEKE